MSYGDAVERIYRHRAPNLSDPCTCADDHELDCRFAPTPDDAEGKA